MFCLPIGKWNVRGEQWRRRVPESRHARERRRNKGAFVLLVSCHGEKKVKGRLLGYFRPALVTRGRKLGFEYEVLGGGAEERDLAKTGGIGCERA